MIVVLGPRELADAVTAVFPGELVVGAQDDRRMAGPAAGAAEAGASLPLPCRACVIGSDTDPEMVVAAVREAGGSLAHSRLVVVGQPPDGLAPAAWRRYADRLGAACVLDVVELATLLSTDPDGRRDLRVRPGAPEIAAWREALRAADGRRLTPRRDRRRLRPGRGEEDRLDAVIRRPLDDGCHTVAVISPKGGVGKTLLSFLLGSTLAEVRRDRVLVVDTNPDFGTLADLVETRVPATISDLLRDLPAVRSFEVLSTFVTTTETGLHILAAPQDPVEMGRLGSGGYRAVNDLIRRHYDLVVYDCGTGFLDEITQFALRAADQVALVSAPLLVTSKIILQAVDHLEATSFDLGRSTLVLNMTGRHDHLDRGRLATAIHGRVGGIVEVPFDERVQRDIDLGRFHAGSLQTRTRVAVKRLGADLVGRLPGPAAAVTPIAAAAEA